MEFLRVAQPGKPRGFDPSVKLTLTSASLSVGLNGFAANSLRPPPESRTRSFALRRHTLVPPYVSGRGQRSEVRLSCWRGPSWILFFSTSRAAVFPARDPFTRIRYLRSQLCFIPFFLPVIARNEALEVLSAVDTAARNTSGARGGSAGAGMPSVPRSR